MKKILVIGACGQIGSELTPALRKVYGTDNVVAADLMYPLKGDLANSGPSCKIDATNAQDIADAVKRIPLRPLHTEFYRCFWCQHSARQNPSGYDPTPTDYLWCDQGDR